MSRLTCRSPDGEPVYGDVDFVFTREGEAVYSIEVQLEDDGGVTIPSYGGLAPTIATVMPRDRHWSAIVPIQKGDNRQQLVPFEMPKQGLWWRRLVGRRAMQPRAGAGMRVGVVDLGFKAEGSLGHVDRYDIEGRRLRAGFGPASSHGLRICKIIAERGASLEREGIARAADIVLVDVADDDSPAVIDSDKVAPAVELLADEFGVDLINISAGAYVSRDDANVREVLLKSIRYARSTGALTIAAAGNRPEDPAMPARFEEVVAVGSVGLWGVAPPATLMDFYGDLALAEGLVGTSSLGKVFHDIDSCYGKDLDVVGPGIGVTLCYDDGIIMDYRGTSYAAPVVCGVLACRLASSEDYAALKGAERADFAQSVLEDMCQETGLPELRQGHGLPILPVSN
jgi:subtilisin